MKRSIPLSIAIATLIVLANVSVIDSENRLLACLACEDRVVDKTPSEAFTVEITFRSTGKTEGTWSVNVAFEGEKWTWSGTSQNLTLKPSHTKTLTWNGNVPSNAPIDSMVRLIVYYGDSYVRLNWWVHVVAGAELTITSGTVK